MARASSNRYAAWDLPAGETSAFTAFNAATFTVLSFGYFNFVQMNLSSLRLRIANELH